MTIHPWQATFMQTIQQREVGNTLQQAARSGELSQWTKALTQAIVTACQEMGWQASGKGHPLELLPVDTNEFLAMDVTAFAGSARRWHLPIAVMELENQPARVPYSLWKVLCVRSQLRVVFGYSQTSTERVSMINTLKNEVVRAIEPSQRMQIEGSTLVAVGSRDDAEQFPYGYFKWWHLENNTGTFSVI